MAFIGSLNIAASGITAQRKRMDVITENIVNRETTRTEDGGPYRRKLTVFREIPGQSSFSNALSSARNRQSGSYGGVMVSEIIEDETDFTPVYDPGHPDADEDGYVMMPNVNGTTEMVDAMSASRSYSANIAVFEAIKSMAQTALELGK